MFSKKVVLILGAGASAEIGLPVGDTLKKQIIDDVDCVTSAGRITRGDSAMYHAFSSATDGRFGDFEIGQELARVLRAQATIDEALHYLGSSVPQAVVLGKMAIVKNILRGERESALSTRFTGISDLDSQMAMDSWYFEFLSILMAGTKREEMRDSLKNVTIINFNYDRSFEHYLYHGLQWFGRLDSQAAGEALQALKIIRPYGSIGPLSWQAGGLAIDYAASVQIHNELAPLSKNIRTFTEQCDEGVPEAIDGALNEAHLILILGFGFHETNMDLLEGVKGRSHLTRDRQKTVLCTAFKFPEINHRLISERLDGMLTGYSGTVTLYPLTAGKLLSDARTMITNASR